MKPIALIKKETGFFTRQLLKFITKLQELCVKLRFDYILYLLELLHFRLFFGVSFGKCQQRRYILAALHRHFNLVMRNAR
jgi:hypothetical protein